MKIKQSTQTVNQHIAICSLVRNGIDNLPVYRRQLEQLTLNPSQTWQLYILDGNSTDGSKEYVEKWTKEDERVVFKKRRKI